MRMKQKLRLVTAIFLAALLAAGGATHAASAQQQRQQQEAEKLTPDERREAGEFLLRLDERWREARDFNALFADAFVSDFDESPRSDAFVLPLALLDESLRDQLSAAERRRANVAGLDFIYVSGRVILTFEQVEKNRRAAKRAAAASRPRAADGRGPSGADDDEAEPSPEEVFSPAVFETFRSSPLLAEMFPEGCDEGGEACESRDVYIKTHGQFDEVLSALERATPKMRARVRELEAELRGATVSAVPREDENEGEWPELELRTLETSWRNRPAGTHVVSGYISIMQVHLVKEGGRYKVIDAVYGN